MIDYYSILGLSRAASEETIFQKLSTLSSPTHQNAIKYILLNPGRRKIYDRNWSSAKNIGKLRANLEMGNSEFWNNQKYGDFSASKDAYPPLLAQLKATTTNRAHTQASRPNPAARSLAKKTFYTILVLFIGIGVINMATETPSKKRPTLHIPPKSQATPSIPPQPAFHAPVKPLPVTGVISKISGEAPFQIKTGEGENYFIKLCRSNGKCVLMGFIRGGSTLDTTAPLGTYELRYAMGEKWYGMKHLFGPKTSYHMAEEPFTFSLVGNQYSGYTVELIKQVGGNLNTHGMSKDDF